MFLHNQSFENIELDNPEFEYLEDDQSTWKFQKLPDIPQEFQDELTKLGGLNRFGQPMLKAVKGNEELSDRSFEKRLKYSCGNTPFEVAGYRYLIDGEWQFSTNIDHLPDNIFVLPHVQQEELGLLRYVIEKWVSPEELERLGRHRTLCAPGDITPTLRERPRAGVYDPYLVVESANGRFRKLDRDVLEYLRMRWNYDKLPFAEREADYEAAQNKQESDRKAQLKEIWDTAGLFDIRLDPEERERREEYWAKKRDWDEDRQRFQGTATFYQYDKSSTEHRTAAENG